MPQKLTILLSAYACSPYSGSEPGVGWSFVSALSKKYKVILLTEKNEFQADIEHYYSNYELQSDVEVYYIPRKHTFLDKKNKIFYYLTYMHWQYRAYKLAAKITQERNVDIVHQLNMIGFREPGFLYRLNLPLVWGPVGGLGYVHKKHFDRLLFKYKIAYWIYNLMTKLQFACGWRVQKMLKKSHVISSNSENAFHLNQKLNYRSPIIVPVSSPINIQKVSHCRDFNPSSRIKIVWSGLLVPRKDIFTALKIIKKLLELGVDVELNIYGTGPQEKRANYFVERYNLQTNVTFHGPMTRSEYLVELKKNDIFLFTSIREGTPTVIAEALSLGLPVLARNVSGMPDMVQNGGILIGTDELDDVVAFAEGVLKICKDRNTYQTFSAHALSDAKKLSFDEKMKILERVYKKTIRG